MRFFRQIEFVFIVQFLSSSIFISSVFSQQHALFNRIYDGDYIWSSQFPKEEAGLLGYGYALFNELNQKCPGLVSSNELSEVNSFFTTITDVGTGSNLRDAFSRELAVGASYVTLKTAARAKVHSIVDASSCRSPQVNRVTRNVARMLSGKRPMYVGAGVKKSTLVDQKIVPIDTYHYYSGHGPSLAAGHAARIFESVGKRGHPMTNQSTWRRCDGVVRRCSNSLVRLCKQLDGLPQGMKQPFRY